MTWGPSAPTVRSLSAGAKSLILSANGQNIYPKEIEAKLNNLPGVAESLVVERNGRLVALVYPGYEQITEIVLFPTEFDKTPQKSIKRYLYNV